MLMRSEPPRPYRASLSLDGLINPDVIAVVCFAAVGLLITIVLAWFFPSERAIDLLTLT
jgi:hypothetical protein